MLPPVTAACAALLLAAAPLTPLHAQQPAKSVPQNPDTRVVLDSLEIPAGSLGAAIAATRDAFRAKGDSGNVVIRGDAEVRHNGLSLRQVTFEQALSALTVAASSNSVQVQAQPMEGKQTVVWVERANQGGNQPVNRVFRLGEFVNASGPEKRDERLQEVQDAVKIAFSLSLQTNPEVNTPQTAFHAETGLFFVNGSRDGVELVEQVINALVQKPAQPAVISRPAARQTIPGTPGGVTNP